MTNNDNNTDDDIEPDFNSPPPITPEITGEEWKKRRENKESTHHFSKHQHLGEFDDEAEPNFNPPTPSLIPEGDHLPPLEDSSKHSLYQNQECSESANRTPGIFDKIQEFFLGKGSIAFLILMLGVFGIYIIACIAEISQWIGSLSEWQSLFFMSVLIVSASAVAWSLCHFVIKYLRLRKNTQVDLRIIKDREDLQQTEKYQVIRNKLREYLEGYSFDNISSRSLIDNEVRERILNIKKELLNLAEPEP